MNPMERVQNILLHPTEEWQVINAETTNTGGLYAGYIMPLAAIGPLGSIIGMSLIGVSVPFVGGRFRVPLGSSLVYGLLSYGLSLISIYVLAQIINALAPTFAGTKDNLQALKVATYSSTAGWIAGVFSLIPALSVLGIVGLYSLYLLYVGLPVLMKSPKERALGYTAVVVVCGIVLFVVSDYVASAFTTYPTPPLNLPGVR